MRHSRTLWGLMLLAVLLLSSGCPKTVPPGYEAVQKEANLVEASAYIKAMRDAYVGARQKGILSPAQFQMAVKADESLTALWTRYLAAVTAKNDDYKLYAEVIQATTTLENLLIAWIPEFVSTTKKKPDMLGAK